MNRNYYSNNESYNHIIFKLKDYMINSELYNKYKLVEKEINIKEDSFKKNKIQNKESEKIITIKEIDQLFWYFFIASFGYDEYKFLDNKKFTVEKEIKIKNTENIKKDTLLLKQNKIKICDFESDLVNSKKISLSTLKGLCIYNNINLLYVKNKIYYNFNFSDDKNFIIIYDYGTYCSCNINPSHENIDTIKNSLYLIENPEKPIKAVSNFKLPELIEIANKLSINYKSESGKSKNKNQLYEEIKNNL